MHLPESCAHDRHLGCPLVLVGSQQVGVPGAIVSG